MVLMAVIVLPILDSRALLLAPPADSKERMLNKAQKIVFRAVSILLGRSR